MELTIFALLILIELGFLVTSLIKKNNFKKQRAIAWICFSIIFSLLLLSPLIDWSIKWMILTTILIIQTILGIIRIVKKKENSTIKNGKSLLLSIGRIMMIIIALTPVILFPQFEHIKRTGPYEVESVSYTITDESRDEDFTLEDDKRKLTIQFWYPSTLSSKFPLVVFSHGAFGFRLSNFSTFEELASNGYIVCSIDHTYHAFLTRHLDGSLVLANNNFLNETIGTQAGTIPTEEVDRLKDNWMKLRTEDMYFVIDYIKKESLNASSEKLFSSIDTENIGIFGHSMGGATSAEMGRMMEDIDAVIVVDGTMLGEVSTNPPYPKPILNIYNQKHYEEAQSSAVYPNKAATNNATESYEVVIEGSGHMNFTDLAIVSPILSNKLELGSPGTVDPRYCIETTNEVILEFFNRYLKNDATEIVKERTY